MKKKYELITFSATAVLLMIIFSSVNRMFGGGYTIIRSDLQGQIIPAFKMFLRNLLDGNSLSYSFEFSMGMTSLPLYAFYSCFCPLNIIYLFVSDVNIASAILILLKLSLASTAFYGYCKYVLQKEGYSSVFFSCFYGCSGFFFLYYFGLMYLDAAYMLPVIIILIDLLWKQGKIWPLSLAYFYLFIVNFYIGYIVGIFSFLYMIVFYMIGRKMEIKKLLSYVYAVITAVLLSGIVLYPTAVFIFQNMAEDSTRLSTLKVSILDIWGNLFLGQMQSLEGPYPVIYCGIPALMILPSYFLNSKNGKQDKIKYAGLLLFLILCSMIRPLYLFMHAFDAPDYLGHRYSFLYSFLILTIAVKECAHMKENSKYYYLIVIGINLLAYYLSYYFQLGKLDEKDISSSVLGLELNGFFLAAYALLVHLQSKKEKQRMANILFLLAACFELILNGYMTQVRWPYTLNENKVVYDLKNLEAETALTEIADYESSSDQDLFYRVYYENTYGGNMSGWYDYKSTGYFSSIENYPYRQLQYRMGYSASPRRLSEYGSTDLTRMIYGEKYTIFGQGIRGDSLELKDPLWQKNESCLGLGYMVDSDILDLQVDSENVFDNQNQFLSALCGQEMNYWKMISKESISVSTNNMVMQTMDGKTYFETEDKSNPEGTISFLCDVDSESLYAYISEEGSVYDTNSPYIISEGGDVGCFESFSYLSMPHILNLGKNSSGRYQFDIMCGQPTLNYGCYNSVYAAYPDDEILANACEDLKTSELQITEFRNNHIRGTVTAASDRPVLFTTIPYDANWHAYVDGQETETKQAVNGVFLAVELSPGEHEIEFRFVYKELKTGLVISLTGLSFFFAGIVYGTIQRKKGSKNRR